MIFGRFQIDESAAMDHFNVNRVALREVLSRLVDRGPVEKSTYAAWRVAAKADRKSTRLNSSHSQISYAVFCLKKKRGVETERAIAVAPPHRGVLTSCCAQAA